MANLTEKFKSLTQDSREKFLAVKSEPELCTFLDDTGVVLSQEEKAVVLDYINNGKLELSDDEMDSVSGGKNEASAWEADGRRIRVVFLRGEGKCCSKLQVYARNREEVRSPINALMSYYYDCKCYNCGNTEDVIGVFGEY